MHLGGMKKDSQITVRISSDLKAALEALAKQEDRSLAYVVERILRKHFEVKKSK
jgi:predicted transcriptional regulator